MTNVSCRSDRGVKCYFKGGVRQAGFLVKGGYESKSMGARSGVECVMRRKEVRRRADA